MSTEGPLENNTPEEQTYASIAKKIITSAFRSAICIDDGYASAYSVDETLNRVEPKALYDSFREKACCDLNVFEFKDIASSWKTHMLENKDLMILDWELDPGGRHDSTLTILQDVIRSKKIPFILIYTNTEYLDNITKTLITSFNPVSNEQYAMFVDAFNKGIVHISDDPEIDFEDLRKDEASFFEYLHNFSKTYEAEKTIFDCIRSCFNIKETISDEALKIRVKRLIKQIFDQSDEVEIEYLAFLVLGQSKTNFTCAIQRIKIGRHAYLVNQFATVIIFHKQSKSGGITPELLFEEFARSITSDPNNFLTLLSLEFKDRLKENFSVIGAKFSSIDEKAFLYHMGNYQSNGNFKKGAIYDFILRSWMNELFQQKIGEKSDVLDFLSSRYEELKINDISANDEPILELLKYSAFISTTDLSFKTSKDLWFGDIFKSETGEYFLCITPHCDCLRPSKIKHNFYFVKGTKVNDDRAALKNAEKDFFSFVIDDKPVAIEWKCKPFTIYIKDSTINNLKISYMQKEYQVTYVTSLKENYSQRISNESFSYGFRVGIDLPHISGSDEED